MKSKKVEIILTTLNAMPHLKSTFDSLKKSNYKNFKIIIQDGGSRDGTVDYIKSQKEVFDIDLSSSPDSGIAQACARALKRASKNGFIFFLSADETIEKNFFDIHLSYFNENPNLLAIYGSVLLFDPKKNTQQRFNAGTFSLKKVITCECIPPLSTCMFNLNNIGDDFWVDDELKLCSDYDLWLRLALKYPEEKFLNIQDLLTRNRMDEVSTSFRSNSYLICARSKVSILKKNLELINNNKSLKGININELFIEIYCWAAKMVFSFSNVNQDYIDILSEAIKNFGKSEKLLKLASKSDELQDWLEKGCKGDLQFKKSTFLDCKNISYSILNPKLGILHTNNGAKQSFTFGTKIKVKGGNSEWDYIWWFELKWWGGKKFLKIMKKLSQNLDLEHTKKHQLIGLKCTLRVNHGQIGICILNNSEIDEEVVIVAGNEIKINLKIRQTNKNPILCIRNHGIKNSSVTLSKLILCKIPITPIN